MKQTHQIPTPQPREEAILATIQASTQAFRRSEATRPLSQPEFFRQQSKFIRKTWWALQAGVLVLLWWLLKLAGTTEEVQRSLGSLAPIFVVLLLPELWKNRACGALEVECASYYSLRHIYAARMVLFGLADLVLLSLFFAAAVGGGMASVSELIVHFLLPFLVTACLCLRLLACRRAGWFYLALPLSLVWTVVWLQVILHSRLYAALTLPMWLGFVGLGFAYLIYSIFKLQTTCEKLWEVSPSWN